MSEAELRITHATYPIKGKADAFWYNFLEGVGRASGWIFVLGLVLLVLKYVDDETPVSDETQIEQQQ